MAEERMSTILTSPYTIPAALVTGETGVLGVGTEWSPQPGNHTQEVFLQLYRRAKDMALTLPEIEAILSWNADDINRFLREHGFSIELEPLDDDTFGVGVVFKWLSDWLIQGEDRNIRGLDGRTYPGVFMREDLRMYAHQASSYPAVAIPAANGDIVFLTAMDSAPEDEFELIEAALRFRDTRFYRGQPELHFPMIDALLKGPIEWLLGLRATLPSGQKAFISQALRQSFFKLDPYGAEAGEAVALAVTLEAMVFQDQTVVIDRPFMAVVERPQSGLELPIFAAYLDIDSWSRPER